VPRPARTHVSTTDPRPTKSLAQKVVRHPWTHLVVAGACFFASLATALLLLLLSLEGEGDGPWLVKSAVLVLVGAPALAGHAALRTLRPGWGMALVSAALVVIVVAFPTTSSVELPSSESTGMTVVGLSRNFELVRASAIGAGISAIVAVGVVILRHTQPSGTPTGRQVALHVRNRAAASVTGAAFVLAIMSEDAWQAASRLNGSAVAALMALACILALYVDPLQRTQSAVRIRLAVVGALIALAFGVFYAIGSLLVDPQTAVGWIGMTVEDVDRTGCSECAVSLTSLTGGPLTRLAGVFSAVALLAIVDTDQVARDRAPSPVSSSGAAPRPARA
jgi:hypothetical protein